MPDKRIHRGPHPEDAQLFTAETQPILQQAVAEMSWLLSRGYADKSTLKLVGDRYSLTQRQRLAVMRASCSDSQLENRIQKQVMPEKVKSQALAVDGFNLLITIEAALSGGLLFIGRDGCIRDLSSIHGTYRKVEETLPSVDMTAGVLSKLNISEVVWLFDQPVSNSGRLKQLITSYAQSNCLNWDVRLVPNPDRELIKSTCPVVTSDSNILDSCIIWLNLTGFIIEAGRFTHGLNLFDLRTKEVS